jgi:uncharacterized membrane protein
MSDWSSWFTDNPGVAVVALFFGGVFAVSALALLIGFLITLSGISPVLGFAGLVTILLFGYFGLRYVQESTETADQTAVDPVTELEGRYVRGELSDEEFEHRLNTIIETEDERGRQTNRSTSTDTVRNHEVDTETR